MMRHLVCTAIALLLVGSHAPTRANSLSFVRLGVTEGLSQSSVYSLAQDRQGFLWFGTADGLNRYDGYTFKTYRRRVNDPRSLPSNAIRTIYEDPSGELWIGTDAGLCMYDRGTDSFTQLNLKPANGSQRVNASISSILLDGDGTMWIGSALGLFSLRSDSASADHYLFNPDPYSPENIITAVTEEEGGGVWVGTRAGLRFVQRKAGQLAEVPLPGFFRNLRSSPIRLIHRDDEGYLWIATTGQLMGKIDVKRKHIRYYTTKSEGEYINAIRQDGKGNFWFASSTGRLYTLDRATGELKAVAINISSIAQPMDYLMTSMIFDRSNIMWLGIDGQGILKCDDRRKKFQTYMLDSNDRGGSPSVYLKAILEDEDGIVWLGTFSRGLLRLDRKTGDRKRFVHDPGKHLSIPGNSVTALYLDADMNLWLGTDGGLGRFNRTTGECERFPFPSSGNEHPHPTTVNSIVGTSEGTLLVGTRSDLHVFDLSRRIFLNKVHSSGDADNSLSVFTIYRANRDRYFLGLYSSTMFEYDLRTRTARPAYTLIPDSSIGYPNAIRGIYEDADGILWLGTEDGLFGFNPKSKVFSKFGEEHGLANGFIYGLLGDEKGHLWMSTNKGISRFDLRTRKFRNYGTEDGLQSTEFNTGAYFQSKRGEMFFGGINGLNTFFPDSVRDNPHVPTVLLTGFKKFDLPFDVGVDPAELKELRLNHDDNVISFQFTGLEYTDPSKNQYAHKLEGFEPDWVYCGTRREVRYTRLAPGDYIFRVKATNNDGVWNETGTAIRVRIVPPLWSQWWFIALGGMIVVGAIGGSLRLAELRKIRREIERLEREQALERERARISKDMHDDVGANLTKIAIMSELALQATTTSETRSQLERISQTSREVVDNIGDIIWAINPQNDRLDNLAGYVREHVSEFLDGTEIVPRFEFADNLPAYHLSAESRRNIFLTIKEAVHNVVKHSRASTVTITLHSLGTELAFEVKDDGIGLTQTRSHGFGNGLHTMKKRIDDIGGRFTLESGTGCGTRIAFYIPVHPPYDT